MDTDAQWTKKNERSFFGYKDHVCTDVENVLIRKYAVTGAAVHDSQVFQELLDYSNSNADVFADSAYSSKRNIETLEALGFRDRMNRKAQRGKPLTERQKASNRGKSAVRSRIEHIFGMIYMATAGKLMRGVGLARIEARIGLRNIAYNMRRLITLVEGRPSIA